MKLLCFSQIEYVKMIAMLSGDLNIVYEINDLLSIKAYIFVCFKSISIRFLKVYTNKYYYHTTMYIKSKCIYIIYI